MRPSQLISLMINAFVRVYFDDQLIMNRLHTIAPVLGYFLVLTQLGTAHQSPATLLRPAHVPVFFHP